MRENVLLRIEQATTAADGVGGQTVSWSTLLTWWARATPAGGGEQEQRLGRLATVARISYAGRFDPRITTLHRVNDGSQVLNIRSIDDPDGNRRRMVLLCESGVTT